MQKSLRDIFDDALYLRVLEMRQYKRWTIRHIARRTGVGVGTIHRIIKRFNFGPKRNKGVRRRKIRMFSLSDVFEV
jgi:hypothetical protein